mgnify:CR=1 FL=1
MAAMKLRCSGCIRSARDVQPANQNTLYYEGTLFTMNPQEARDAIRRYVTADLMRKPNYKLDDNARLISGGLIDSFSLASLAMFLEETFNVNPDNTDLNAEHMDSVTMIAEYVAAHGG